MQLEVGMVLEGKVTGITKFGAFIELPGGKTGMVHISEVAPTFVKEIRDFVTENQTVKVKVLSISEDGKVSLSMKKAMDPAPRPQQRSSALINPCKALSPHRFNNQIRIHSSRKSRSQPDRKRSHINTSTQIFLGQNPVYQRQWLKPGKTGTARIFFKLLV